MQREAPTAASLDPYGKALDCPAAASASVLASVSQVATATAATGSAASAGSLYAVTVAVGESRLQSTAEEPLHTFNVPVGGDSSHTARQFLHDMLSKTIQTRPDSLAAVLRVVQEYHPEVRQVLASTELSLIRFVSRNQSRRQLLMRPIVFDPGCCQGVPVVGSALAMSFI